MSKNWEVSYRYKDSLAIAHIWAPDEDQAEKKFKARKEFEYDPKYDRNPEEGNIRSIYEPVVKSHTKRKEIDELVRFCLPEDLRDFINEYDAIGEEAVVKQVPLTDKNKSLIKKLAKIYPIKRAYRGSSKESYTRPRSYCHKDHAERVSVYLR